MWGAEAGLDQGLACLARDHGLDVSLGKGVDVAHLTGIRNSVWVPVSVDIHKPGRETDRIDRQGYSYSIRDQQVQYCEKLRNELLVENISVPKTVSSLVCMLTSSCMCLSEWYCQTAPIPT